MATMGVNGEIIISLEKVSKHYGELPPGMRAGRLPSAAATPRSLSRGQTVQGEAVVNALCEVDLTIMRGERVAVMGPSGSGKSTLLNLICGLDEPTFGCVKFQGLDLSKLSDDERTRLRRQKIGMIFQTFNLLPTLSAIENVSLPLRLQGSSRREGEKRAGAMLRRVGLAERGKHRPDELSGGERQRVAIARALIFQPPLVLADEPTGNLDSATGEAILNLLTDLHRELNTTIILVTHNELAAGHCERILTLHDGSIVKDQRTIRGVPSATAEVS